MLKECDDAHEKSGWFFDRHHVGHGTHSIAPAIGAGFEAGGGGNCREVQRQITSDWFQMKGFFRPDNQSLKRPGSRDFYCVAPGYVRDAIQQPSRTASLKCYSLQGQKFCCDSGLRACAGLE